MSEIFRGPGPHPGSTPSHEPIRSRGTIPPVLEVEGLRTRFDLEGGPIYPVDGVSFRLAPGETVGLVGESGAGKSMTALSILGLVPPPGRVEPGARIRHAPPGGGRVIDLATATPAEVRRLRGDRVAMIFQEPMTSLNPVHTVGRQIDEVFRVHRNFDAIRIRERSVELLREVGVPEPELRHRAYPHQLSGGMRQRVMIAMALACEPDLLIADEPTTALDVTIQAQILDLLQKFQERRGMAILLVTHDLAVVEEVCDRVLVMYAGEIVERGKVDSVFSAPLHPYTRGLLDSLPRGDGRPLRPIPGRIPVAGTRSRGCRFAPRCRWAIDECEVPPPLEARRGEGRDGRATRCRRVLRGEVTLDGGAG
ncbi:MAG: ABC transporter ATP-binding protein [Longimicrobiales bacterium]|nr:ABC transporter ATP-binding protein [Longimicrobiales bacterium]